MFYKFWINCNMMKEMPWCFTCCRMEPGGCFDLTFPIRLLNQSEAQWTM